MDIKKRPVGQTEAWFLEQQRGCRMVLRPQSCSVFEGDSQMALKKEQNGSSIQVKPSSREKKLQYVLALTWKLAPVEKPEVETVSVSDFFSFFFEQRTFAKESRTQCGAHMASYSRFLTLALISTDTFGFPLCGCPSSSWSHRVC